jgi:excisionase family DNA binding protein
MKAEIDRNKLIRIGEVISYLQIDCYLDKAESAKYLGIGIRTLESWLTRIPHYRPGGKTLFRKSELDAFMKRHQELPNDVDVAAIADEAVRKVLG